MTFDIPPLSRPSIPLISSLSPGAVFVLYVSRPEIDGEVWMRCSDRGGDRCLQYCVRLSDGMTKYLADDSRILPVEVVSPPMLRYV